MLHPRFAHNVSDLFHFARLRKLSWSIDGDSLALQRHGVVTPRKCSESNSIARCT